MVRDNSLSGWVPALHLGDRPDSGLLVLALSTLATLDIGIEAARGRFLLLSHSHLFENSMLKKNL